MQNKLSSFHWLIIKGILLYILWLGFYYQWGIPKEGIDDQTTELVAYGTIKLFNILGYESSGYWALQQEPLNTLMPLEEAKAFIVVLNNEETVAIGNSCNGLFIIALYVGFILIYPGKLMYKSFFIVGGSLGIFFINILRIILLSLNAIYFPSSLDFNHTYTYTFVVYSAVFMLWMWWVNKYSSTSTLKAAN